MTELYKEALAEAKKLKQLAEEDAKKKIIEQVTPFIKKMIVQEAADFFTEESEEAPKSDTSTTPNGLPIVASGEPEGSEDSGVEMSEENESSMADPLGIMGKTLEDLVGKDGKITIDSDGKITIQPDVETVMSKPIVQVPPVELPAAVPPPEAAMPPIPPPVSAPAPDLNAPPVALATPAIPGPVPAPVPPLAENYQKFRINLGETALKIDEAYYAKKTSNVLVESLKQKLFHLLEDLDHLNHSGKITENEKRLNEKKLEFLFAKLKEAKLSNSYTKTKIKEEKIMGSLKEFASKLFEGEDLDLHASSTVSGKTGVAVKSAASAHAKKVSGVAPGVDLFSNEEDQLVGADALEGTGDAEEEYPNPLAEGAEGFGDSDEEPAVSPEMAFDISDDELMEAVRMLRKESKAAAAAAPKGSVSAMSSDELADEEWPVGDSPVGGEDPSLKNLDENLVLTLTFPDDVELDASDVDVSVSSEEDEDMEDMEDEEEMSMDDEEEDEDMEDMDDEEEMSMDDDEEEEEEGEEELLYGEEEEEEEMEESWKMESVRSSKKARLLESKLHKTTHAASHMKKLAESRDRELKTIKTEMAETNLFLSKVLLLNKFLQREDLSKTQKQAIVEHLDRATTIAEAKQIYTKIKNKLNEAADKSKVVGNSSTAVSSGTAGFKIISESAEKTKEVVLGTPERWAFLVKGGRRED
jgi:hypothetical protein